MSAVCINLTRKEKENIQHSFLKSDLVLTDFFFFLPFGRKLECIFKLREKPRKERKVKFRG